MSCTIHDIARVLDLKENMQGGDLIRFLLTDSRRLIHPPSTLFFALDSPVRDGHEFIPELAALGVKNFVVRRPIGDAGMEGLNFLVVADPLKALQRLAAWHRARFQHTVLGITGSNGKTVVKEWLNQVLQPDFRVCRSPRSYNSQIGVPLSLWQLDAEHELGIFEAGISRPGEMDRLQSMIQPTMGILTHFGEAHSEGFVSERQKLEEKIRLFRDCRSIIFRDDKTTAAYPVRELLRRQNPAASLLSWGLDGENTLQVLRLQRREGKTSIEARYEGHSFELQIPFTDEASIENALTCWTALLGLGLKHATIAERMARLQPVNMRLELKEGIQGCSLINDSYSNDPGSLAVALDFMAQQAGDLRKTVILSDFLQSSRGDEELYDQVWNDLRNHRVSKFIGVGPRIQGALGKRARLGEMAETLFFESTEAFLQQVRLSAFKEEIILVKGARVYEFEKIVAALEQKSHQTVLEIDLNALAHNLREFRSRLAPGVKVMAMVKAFAYGSGAKEIGGILQYHKVDYLGVAYTDEGVELRKSGINLPIMVMNPEEATFSQMIAYHLEPEIYSLALLEQWEGHLEKEGLQDYPIHIELETGMNRLGFSHGELPILAGQVSKGRCRVVSCFSHLAASESSQEDAFTKNQYDRLMEAVVMLKSLLGYPFLVHLANSAGSMRHHYTQLDMVRLGIGLYGIDQTGQGMNIQPVATLRTTIAQIKSLEPGETVSYNRKGLIVKPSRVATLRIGYADGIPRRLGPGGGHVLIRGRLAPIVGTVCMDMFMVDITEIHGVKEGDSVEIFGKSLPLQQVAAWAGTIPYEIMTGISQRVKRVYYIE